MNLTKIIFIIIYFHIISFILKLPFIDSGFEPIMDMLFFPLVLSFLLYLFPIRKYEKSEKKEIGIILGIMFLVTNFCRIGIMSITNLILLSIGTIIYVKAFTVLEFIIKVIDIEKTNINE